jgi:hypothetical protein
MAANQSEKSSAFAAERNHCKSIFIGFAPNENLRDAPVSSSLSINALFLWGKKHPPAISTVRPF